MNIKSYIKPELELHSLFAQENIAAIPFYDGGSDSKGEGSSSVFIENGGNWELWD